MLLLQGAYRITDQNPLGSAAGYGSSFPINRQMTTDLLGFESMNYNVVYAQMGRGKVEKIITFALASVAATPFTAGIRCLPVYVPEFQFRLSPRRIDYRIEHYAT